MNETEIKEKIQSYLQGLLEKTEEKQKYLVKEDFLEVDQKELIQQICSDPRHEKIVPMLETCRLTFGDTNTLIQKQYEELVAYLKDGIAKLQNMNAESLKKEGQEMVNVGHEKYKAYKETHAQTEKTVIDMVNNLYGVRDRMHANKILDYIQKNF